MNPALERNVRASEVIDSSLVLFPWLDTAVFSDEAIPDLARARRRRVLNVAVAVLLLMLAWPLMLVIAVLIRLTSPGPIVYTQTRVGLDRRGRSALVPHRKRRVDYGGKLFTIYKFRTMRVDASSSSDQVWAHPSDARVTPLGRVLRMYRLDELPQLVNVLKGDMNIVGPRPEQPNIFVDMREKVSGYPVRQRVLPGITGLAQINHHYDRSIDDVRRKVQYDLQYLCRQSVLEDLRILLLTVPVILFKRGAW
jgi:lipopolysaccharide/colanic/teichoic acid biosynthesis glycosyltransferase